MGRSNAYLEAQPSCVEMTSVDTEWLGHLQAASLEYKSWHQKQERPCPKEAEG